VSITLPVQDEATILLVDDRQENLLALGAALEPLGHRLLTATSGDEALRHLLVEDVALILLDVQMPGMDGFETASHIKRRERTQDIPIVFLTAYDQAAVHAIDGFSSGAVDYLAKPVDPSLLRAKVEVFVELFQKTRILQRQSEILGQRLDAYYEAEARNLRKLTDAALVINSTLSLDEMLRVITDSAREVTGAQQAETLLMGGFDAPITQTARSYSAKYAAWAGEGRQVDLSSMYAMVWDRSRPVRMTKKEIEANFAARGLFGVVPGHPMLEGWLAVPLLGRTGRHLGLIQVADKAGGDFSDSDEVVLVQLAQLAAVAIENAERFAHEHHIAETLQRSLLPDALPILPGARLAARYVPGGSGSQVGGDWYDVIILDRARVALSVGDVVGRGPRAAAVRGQLRTAMRAYATHGLRPDELMASLDRLLQGLGESTMATAAYMVVDRMSGLAEVVSAGHPPPLLVTSAGHRQFVELDPHPPLGVSPEASWCPTRVRVDAGTLLMLFTDGLVEERDAPLDQGLRRLAAGVDHLEHDLERLCDDVLAHMGAQAKGDDVALLAVRFTR
jgi:serine phosphatase RsbU (regulator of sigma subunit)/CheY-like chemotaxis protein